MDENRSSLILIVDDNISNLQVLGAVLSGKGYEIAVAAIATCRCRDVVERGRISIIAYCLRIANRSSG